MNTNSEIVLDRRLVDPFEEGRSSYATPKLIEYGILWELTGSGGNLAPYDAHTASVPASFAPYEEPWVGGSK